MLGRKVIYLRCIKCSYNNVAKGIRLPDKKSNSCLYMQVRAFERYIPLMFSAAFISIVYISVCYTGNSYNANSPWPASGLTPIENHYFGAINISPSNIIRTTALNVTEVFGLHFNY